MTDTDLVSRARTRARQRLDERFHEWFSEDTDPGVVWDLRTGEWVQNVLSYSSGIGATSAPLVFSMLHSVMGWSDDDISEFAIQTIASELERRTGETIRVEGDHLWQVTRKIIEIGLASGLDTFNEAAREDEDE